MSGAPNPRPLQPATSPQSSSRRPQSPKNVQSKRLSTACLECQKRKRKCSAEQPCAACVANNTECIFDEHRDKRRKFAAKRMSDELELYKHVVSGLLGAFQSEPAKVEELAQLIRNNATLSDIAIFLRTNIDEHQKKFYSIDDAEIKFLRTEILQADSRRPAPQLEKPSSSLEGLEDAVKKNNFLVHVPAKPWTTVTDDPHFISYLLSLYLTWHHPLFSLFDVDLFLEDAKAGKLESKLCSPFLVNAMLAMGCFTGQPQAHDDSDRKHTLGDHFYREAKRLWDLELGRASLTNVSALAIMAQLAFLRGRDKLGVTFATQATMIYRELSLQLRMDALQGLLLDTRLERSLSTTAWGFCFMNSVFLYALLKPSRLLIPEIPKPSPEHISPAHSLWTPYPIRQPRLSHPSSFTDQVCSLTKIIVDIQNTFFDDERPLTPPQFQAAVKEYRLLLDHWYNGLPDELNVDNSPPPHFICLRIVYHFVYIIIFVKARSYDVSDSAFLDEARAAKIRAAGQMAALCNLHSELYSLYGKPIMVPQASCMSILILLEDLPDPRASKGVFDMCVLLHATCKTMYVAKGMLRMVRPTASRLGVQLPTDVDELLEEFEATDWEDADYRNFWSWFPNYALEENTGSSVEDSFQMGDMLRQIESHAKLRVWEY